VLGEQPSLLQLAGAVLVCGGVLIASGAIPLPRRRGRPPDPLVVSPAGAGR
jgi:drug/metabolite transporter (DMT)-like permease